MLFVAPELWVGSRLAVDMEQQFRDPRMKSSYVSPDGPAVLVEEARCLVVTFSELCVPAVRAILASVAPLRAVVVDVVRLEGDDEEDDVPVVLLEEGVVEALAGQGRDFLLLFAPALAGADGAAARSYLCVLAPRNVPATAVAEAPGTAVEAALQALRCSGET